MAQRVTIRTGRRASALIAMTAALVLGAIPAAHSAQRVTADNASRVSSYLMDKGETALRAGKLDEAQAYFEQSVTAYPRNARSFGYLGQVEEQRGDEGEARRYYGIALAIDPDDRKLRLWEGQAALRAGEMDAAEKHLAALKRICSSGCAERSRLEAAVTAAKAKAETKTEPSAPSETP